MNFSFISRIFLLTALFILPGCGPKTYEFTKFLMDTEVSISISGVPEKKAAESAKLAFQEMEMLDKVFNWRLAGSRLYKLNKEGQIRSDKTLDALIGKSLEYSRLTGGAFDVTIQPLVELWDVTHSKTPPPQDDVKKARKRVNYRHIKIGKRVLRLYGGAKIDLGGIAKGRAVDSAIEVLKACGVRNALVNAGGNIRGTGDRMWKIGIRHPRNDSGKILGVLKLRNRSAATSGDYERYFECGGKRYHHILDPKTGYPADRCISVTVITPLAVDADALSTALFVLGPQKSFELSKKLEGVEFIFVTADGRIISSPGLKGVQLRF